MQLLKDQVSATKEEILPKIYDDANQLDVAEYIDEIYQHYWVTEVSLSCFLAMFVDWFAIYVYTRDEV